VLARSGHSQMGVMHRVETAAENADAHGGLGVEGWELYRNGWNSRTATRCERERAWQAPPLNV
jgi:hypothetical protein